MIGGKVEMSGLALSFALTPPSSESLRDDERKMYWVCVYEEYLIELRNDERAWLRSISGG